MDAVEYLIVGGHAVAFHGYPRVTGDIDFFVRATSENAGRMLGVLDAFGFAGLGLELSDFVTPGRVVQLGRPPNRIDLLTSISGVDFESAWSGRVAGEIDGQPVHFVGLRDLIRNKLSSDREKDRADVAKLRDVASHEPGSRG